VLKTLVFWWLKGLFLVLDYDAANWHDLGFLDLFKIMSVLKELFVIIKLKQGENLIGCVASAFESG